MVIALNMIDVTRKNGDVIQLRKLGEALGCEVVETSALKGMGSQEVAKKAAELGRKGGHREPPHVFAGSVNTRLRTLKTSSPTRMGRSLYITITRMGANTRAASSNPIWRAGTPSSSLSAMKRCRRN